MNEKADTSCIANITKKQNAKHDCHCEKNQILSSQRNDFTANTELNNEKDNVSNREDLNDFTSKTVLEDHVSLVRDHKVDMDGPSSSGPTPSGSLTGSGITRTRSNVSESEIPQKSKNMKKREIRRVGK